MTGPNDGFMSDQEAADVLSNGHPKSDPVDYAWGMDSGFGDNGYDGQCDCDPLDDNCDCADDS